MMSGLDIYPCYSLTQLKSILIIIVLFDDMKTLIIYLVWSCQFIAK